MTQKVLKLTNT